MESHRNCFLLAGKSALGNCPARRGEACGFLSCSCVANVSLANTAVPPRASPRPLRPRSRDRLREEGRQEGRQEEGARVVLRLLRLKFGPLEPEIEELVRSADADRLLEWSERILTAESLQDVLRD